MSQLMVERRRPAISPLVYWAKERESIRKKKAAGQPPPWTEDPILQRYRFCNVRRRDDRVSQWLINNVFPMLGEGMQRYVFIKAVAVSRWVNWPPTLGFLFEPGMPWSERSLLRKKGIALGGIGRVLDDNVKLGTKMWTGAYMVRAPSKKKYPGVGKGKFVAETVVGKLDLVQGVLMEAVDTKSAGAVFKVLCSVPNWGSFMAGQVVADLTYTPLLAGAYDLNTWAPQGPGSKRGFNRLLGRPLKAKIPDDEWLHWLQIWRIQVAEAIGSELNLMDLQNCLCETDKMLRVQNGEGRPRSTYRPETAY